MSGHVRNMSPTKLLGVLFFKKELFEQYNNVTSMSLKLLTNLVKKQAL